MLCKKKLSLHSEKNYQCQTSLETFYLSLRQINFIRNMKYTLIIIICLLLTGCDTHLGMCIDIRNATTSPVEFSFIRTNYSRVATSNEIRYETSVDTIISPNNAYTWDADRCLVFAGWPTVSKGCALKAPLIYPYCSISNERASVVLNNYDAIYEFTMYLYKQKGVIADKFWDNPNKYVKHAEVQIK